MASIFSYKNKKTNLYVSCDVDSIDSITLVPISEYAGLSGDELDTNNENNSRNYRFKRREAVYIPKLLLKIHFKNTNYYEKLIFDQDDEEAYIIYNSLIECLNKISKR